MTAEGLLTGLFVVLAAVILIGAIVATAVAFVIGIRKVISEERARG